MKRYAPDMVGLGAWALVVVGLWGRFGWQAGLIAAGLPFALFYFWGEYRAAGGKA